MSVSRTDFLTGHLAPVVAAEGDTCPICHENFNASEQHGATTYSDPETCRHVFGESCLVRWLGEESGANTCAMCRRVLFAAEVEAEGYDGGDDDESIYTVDLSEVFAEMSGLAVGNIAVLRMRAIEILTLLRRAAAEYLRDAGGVEGAESLAEKTWKWETFFDCVGAVMGRRVRSWGEGCA